VKAKVIKLLRAAISPAVGIAGVDGHNWAHYEQEEIDDLLEVCRINRLGIHILESAKATNTALPADVSQSLQEMQRIVVWQNCDYLKTVRLVAATLQSQGVDFGVFKGALGQHLLYGNYFTKKTTDVDVFVSLADYGRAATALSSVGFDVHEACKSTWWTFFLGEQHLPSQAEGYMPIDLHSRCYQPGCPRPKDPDFFLKSLATHKVGSQNVQTLDLVSNCLYTAMSLSKAFLHHEPGGKYIADLARTFSILDPQSKVALVRSAREQGMLECLAFASDCSKLIFGVGLEAKDLPISKAIHSMSSEHMTMAILTPSDTSISWPRRTKLLMDLTDSLLSLPKAIVWKFASEIWFVLFERGRSNALGERNMSQQPT
jgi:hypothetical protein